ncbi:MAG TPA: transcription termination factor NusA [Candidatus Acidoferrales bacterium]|nr:transcription termination factor NusA [Candidatus Acidoferrales bacterium]
MPAIQRSEFALALNQVASERGVDVSVVLETVQNAILAAYRKDHPGVEVDDYKALLDPNTGEAKIFNGDEDVTPPGFGRIAAQTAKQVILQKIREKEKEAIFTDYRVKIGTIVNGMVLRFAGPNIIVDIGKAEAIMPVSEQIPNEKYHLNQRLVFYLSEIREGAKGEEIVVSRANNGLLDGLFKREVPEVAQGSVEIKTIVREPGNRAKIAVYSTQPGIDPVGSCVGQKGVRVQAIIQELGGLEKIDIIQWSDDTKTYIAQALSPAKNVRVELDEKEKIAHVFVPQDELSLAIGKDGQNVRLAYKLTQYRIEIEGEGAPAVVAEKEAAKPEAKAEAEEAAAENAVAKVKAEIAEDVADDDAKQVVAAADPSTRSGQEEKEEVSEKVEEPAEEKEAEEASADDKSEEKTASADAEEQTEADSTEPAEEKIAPSSEEEHTDTPAVEEKNEKAA